MLGLGQSQDFICSNMLGQRGGCPDGKQTFPASEEGFPGGLGTLLFVLLVAQAKHRRRRHVCALGLEDMAGSMFELCGSAMFSQHPGLDLMLA